MNKENDESKSLAIKDACIRLLPNCAEDVDVTVSPTEFGCNKATFKASVNGNGDYFVQAFESRMDKQDREWTLYITIFTSAVYPPRR